MLKKKRQRRSKAKAETPGNPARDPRLKYADEAREVASGTRAEVRFQEERASVRCQILIEWLSRKFGMHAGPALARELLAALDESDKKLGLPSPTRPLEEPAPNYEDLIAALRKIGEAVKPDELGRVPDGHFVLVKPELVHRARRLVSDWERAVNPVQSVPSSLADAETVRAYIQSRIPYPIPFDVGCALGRLGTAELK